jgi:hypothetical protein
MIEHPEQELRLVGGCADGFWANSGQRQEAPSRSGSAARKASAAMARLSAAAR